MRSSLLAALLATALTPGCGKHSSTPAASGGAAETNAVAVAPAATTPVQAVPQRPVSPPVGAIIPPPAGPDMGPTLEKMTEVLREYIYGRREMPASFEVLVNSGYFKQIPPPPPGKKFAVDPKQRQIVLVDR